MKLVYSFRPLLAVAAVTLFYGCASPPVQENSSFGYQVEKCDAQMVVVLPPGTELLDEPKGEVVASLHEGEELQVSARTAELMNYKSRRNYWYKVRSEADDEGWVWGDDIAIDIKPETYAIQQPQPEVIEEIDALSAEELINAGNRLLQAHKPIEALPYLSKAVELAPDDAMGFFLLGLTYQEIGKDHKAIEPYKRSIEINSKSFWSHNNLGLAYIRMGEFQQAVDVLEIAIKLKPPTDMYNEEKEAIEIAVRNLMTAYRSLGDAEALERLNAEYQIYKNQDDYTG